MHLILKTGHCKGWIKLQDEAKKNEWVDGQDAFYNYRLLTGGRECFVVRPFLNTTPARTARCRARSAPWGVLKSGLLHEPVGPCTKAPAQEQHVVICILLASIFIACMALLFMALLVHERLLGG